MKVDKLLAPAAVLLLCPALFADQITLKNGDRLTGSIERSDDKILVMKTEAAGEVTVKWSAVESIKSDQQLHVGLSGGQTIVGLVSPSDGKLEIATKNAGTVTTTKDAIQLIRSDAEQSAYDASIERLKNPRLIDFWGGFIDFGLSTTRGNSETLSFVMSARAVRRAPRDTISVYANSIFANNGTTGPTVTTANAINGGIRADLNVTERMFVYGFADFLHDEFQTLDLRNVLGGGLGYHVIKTNRTLLDVYGGGAYDQAFYSTPLTIRSGALMAGESLSYSASNRTSFTEKFEFFPNLSETGEYRFLFNLGAATKLKSWLSWQVTFSDGYVSNPPPLIKKNDLLLSTGLRLTFGKGAQ
jgi:putative salt-induced outer membrane protein YdiY